MKVAVEQFQVVNRIVQPIFVAVVQFVLGWNRAFEREPNQLRPDNGSLLAIEPDLVTPARVALASDDRGFQQPTERKYFWVPALGLAHPQAAELEHQNNVLVRDMLRSVAFVFLHCGKASCC